jgi:hypothetical protein
LVPRPLMVVLPVPSAQMTMFFGIGGNNAPTVVNAQEDWARAQQGCFSSFAIESPEPAVLSPPLDDPRV